MDLNEIYVHKNTPFLCLHNSFLKKLTLQDFTVVVRAVPPEEIGRGSSATICSLSVSLILPFVRKGLTMSLHNLHLICERFLFFNLPNIEHLGCLGRKLNQHNRLLLFHEFHLSWVSK